jgi:hypothetical protein
MKLMLASASILALGLGVSGALAEPPPTTLAQAAGAPAQAQMQAQPTVQPQPGFAIGDPGRTGQVVGRINRLDEPGDALYLDTGDIFSLHHDATVHALQDDEAVRVTYETGPEDTLIATNVEVISDFDFQAGIEERERLLGQPQAGVAEPAQPGVEERPGVAMGDPDRTGQVTGHVQRLDEAGDALYLDTGDIFVLHHDATVHALQEGEPVRVSYEEGPGGTLIATDVEVISDVEVDVDVQLREGTAD